MKRTTFLILLLASLTASAQTAGSLTLSLQQAMDTGLKNRYDVQANGYAIALAENAVRKKKNEWLPDIKGSGDIRYNAQVQSTYIPPGLLGLSKSELLTLGAKNATVFGLDLEQPVYAPGITMDVKIAQNELALQKETNRQAATDIKMQIAGAYLDVLLKDLQQQLVSHDERRYREYFELAQGKYDHGSLTGNDYLQIRLDYENAKVQTTKASQNYALAVDNLKHQVNIPAGTTLLLSDTPGSENISQYQPPAAYTVSDRTELRQLRLREQSQRLQLQKTRQGVLPTLSFVGNYSQQFLYDNFNYTKGEWWSPFSYIGLKLTVPLTAHISNRADRREYQFELAQTAWTIRQKTADIDYEVQKTATELDNAWKNMQITKKNYELSDTIYQNQQQQFALGAFQYSSLLDAGRTVSTAEQNYISAVYDYLLATLTYQRATGGF